MNSQWFYLLICFLLSAACLGLASSSVIGYSKADLLSEDAVLSLFRRWMYSFDKRYPKGSAEEQQRYEIFKTNLLHIEQQNLKNISYRLGLNSFADLTTHEFKSKYCGLKFNNLSWLHKVNAQGGVKEEICDSNDFPSSFDWRDKGVVTSVKDQGKCGSCWAFAVVGGTEAMHAIKSGKLVSLSEQELVSCDYTNFGCRGGYMDNAYKWVIQNGGLATEEDYPYVSSLGENPNCNEQKQAKKYGVTIDDYVLVRPNDENALLCAVSKQPVVVGIHASTTSFQMYHGGIFNGDCLSYRFYIDHAVLIVGWGSKNGSDYWIVKNSWGKGWREDGYVYMARNTPDYHGICGINIMPSYPVWGGYN